MTLEKSGLSLTCPVPGISQARLEAQSESLNGGCRGLVETSEVYWSCLIGWWQKPKCCLGRCLGHPRRAMRGLGCPEGLLLSRVLERLPKDRLFFSNW